MANAAVDESVAAYASAHGLASADQIDLARAEQAASSQAGKPISLCEAMVRKGVITQAQGETVEKRVNAQMQGGLQQLGNYKLTKKLGEGGMGAVFLATDTIAQRQVAVKILPRKFAEDQAFLSRFRREARAMGKLNHQNVISAFDVGEELGHHYYVMEYCAGEPLDKKLEKAKVLPVNEALDITAQAARGLQHAHSQGIIHRDIKPANIFITTDGTAKILDLGLSKNISDVEQSFNTQSGVVLGTPHYISPEQALGEKNIDGRTDIYSLGASLYHLLTGQTPFHGPNIPVILTKHLTEQLPNPQDLREDIPNHVVQIMQRMMAKKPENRYKDCNELLGDLDLVLAGQAPVSAVIDSSLSSVAMPAVKGGKTGAKGVRKTTKHDPVAPRTNTASGMYAKPAPKESASNMVYAGMGAAAVVALIAAIALSGGSKQPVKTADAAKSTKTELTKPADNAMQNPAMKAPMNPAPVKSDSAAETKNNERRMPTAAESREILDTVAKLIDPNANATPKNDGEAKATVKLPDAPAETARAAGANANVAAKAAEGNSDAAKSLVAEMRKKELEPLMKAGKFADAIKMVESRMKDSSMAEAADLLKREKEDLEAIRELRQSAYDNLKSKTGSDVAIQFGKTSMNGKLVWDEERKELAVQSGPVARAIQPDNLDAADVDRHAAAAEGDAKAELLRRRGLTYMAAGYTELANKFFTDAQAAGLGDAMAPYLAATAPAEKAPSDKEVASAEVKNTETKTAEPVKEAASTAKPAQVADKGEPAKAAAAAPIKIEELQRKLAATTDTEGQMAVLTEAMRRANPDFEGNVRQMDDYESDRRRPLGGIAMSTARISDISPLAVLRATTVYLNLGSGHQREQSPLSDINPLRGWPLVGLDLSNTRVANLAPIKGNATLKQLNLNGTPVSDLTPLAGMKLAFLDISNTQVKDLNALRFMPSLNYLKMEGLDIKDYSPLAALSQLKYIKLSPGQALSTDQVKSLKQVKSLNTIEVSTGFGGDCSCQHKPDEFHRKVAAGEFKQMHDNMVREKERQEQCEKDKAKHEQWEREKMLRKEAERKEWERREAEKKEWERREAEKRNGEKKEGR